LAEKTEATNESQLKHFYVCCHSPKVIKTKTQCSKN